VESQEPTFDNKDLYWMDLDPLPQTKVQIPSGPGESSRNPGVRSINIENEDDEEDEDYDD
jgi:hypothetical protein